MLALLVKRLLLSIPLINLDACFQILAVTVATDLQSGVADFRFGAFA